MNGMSCAPPIPHWLPGWTNCAANWTIQAAFRRSRLSLANPDRAARPGMGQARPGHGRRHQSTAQQQAAADWDSALAQVRSHEDFRDFLRPPRLKNLIGTTADSTMIVLNAASRRCDALIVNSSGVMTVALPGLTASEAYSRANDFLAALRELEDSRQQPLGAHQEALKTINGTMHWLWEAAAGPALAALGHTTQPAVSARWPRVWWCPTGPLTSLPIHAARPDRLGAPGVLDLVVSSYAPTLRALSRARSRRQPSGAGQILSYRRPRDAVPALRSAPASRRGGGYRSRRYFPGRCTVLQGQEATRERILAELPRHRDIHLSCHGGQDPINPSGQPVQLQRADQHRRDVPALQSGRPVRIPVRMPDRRRRITPSRRGPDHRISHATHRIPAGHRDAMVDSRRRSPGYCPKNL